MTKKDYVLIAETLNKTASWALAEYESRATYCEIVDNLVEALAQNNPRFDRSKFYNACGLRNK